MRFFAPNKDGTPWYARTFRATTARVVAQGFFLALFVFLVWATWLSRLGGYPVSLFLELDPLVGLATALSTHTVYRWLWRGMLILLPTLLLGRFFCNWMCPFGTLHQLTGWMFDIRTHKENFGANRYRAVYQLKYLVLVAMLVMAALGSLQIGLLDPICLLVRTFTVVLGPASDMVVADVAGALSTDVSPLLFAPGAPDSRLFDGTWIVGLVFASFIGLNLVIPRFFCRVLCPLGAMLGVLSRFSLWRIDRDLTRCTDCDLCLRSCQGAADPHAALRKSECFVCLDCIDDCPEGAISFRLAPLPPAPWITRDEEGATLFGVPLKSTVEQTERKGPDIPRRRWLFAAVAGLAAYPFLRLGKASAGRGFSEKLIRPPGSVAEPEFLERCIKCDQCVNVCPTNVLQPAGTQIAELEGLWTPVMDFSVGHCQLNCILCSEVCPTGAIQKTSLERKLGLGEHDDDGPIVLGTAFYDRGRCLPWAMETPCVVCEEVCPVTPKAIDTYDEAITRADGTRVTLNRPYILPERCIGCGLCERECPVLDDAAVYVTAVGESRDPRRSLLL